MNLVLEFFFQGDPGMKGVLATRVSGSADLYQVILSALSLTSLLFYLILKRTFFWSHVFFMFPCIFYSLSTLLIPELSLHCCWNYALANFLASSECSLMPILISFPCIQMFNGIDCTQNIVSDVIWRCKIHLSLLWIGASVNKLQDSYLCIPSGPNELSSLGVHLYYWT
jgi:hypothetical protein